MVQLNQTQLDILDAKLIAGDVAGFYAQLNTYGDPYGRLGLSETS